MSNTSANLTSNAKWLITAKSELKQCTKIRLHNRLKKIEDIINDTLPRHITRFVIDETLKQKICAQVCNAIDAYKGTKKLKHNLEPSLEDVSKKTRTWWNRTKSNTLGSLLFTVICFYVLHNFIKQHCQSLSAVQQITLFISVFIAFMEDTIKFPKTKPKSLIPHQCFLANNEFKDICAEFVRIFGDANIEWNPYVKIVGLSVKDGKRTYEYIKEKNRSANIFTAFKHCLQQIKDKISKDFDGALVVQWNETIHKFRPKCYNLSFTPVTPVRNNSTNVRSDVQSHSNIQFNDGYTQAMNNICVNSDNYAPNVNMCPPTFNSPSTECTDYMECHEYIPPPLPMSMPVNVPMIPHMQFNEYNNQCFGCPQMCQREFQSTNQFGIGSNRIHHRNELCRNDRIEMQSQRREQHIQSMVNNHGLNGDMSDANGQYLYKNPYNAQSSFSLDYSCDFEQKTNDWNGSVPNMNMNSSNDGSFQFFTNINGICSDMPCDMSVMDQSINDCCFDDIDHILGNPFEEPEYFSHML